ncbi:MULTISPECIES: response regulator transcription factor [Enterococcus]|uniref:LuxR family DNA-binding response regulator n=1 Tax=Enterococcus mundtii TaxID=53346 RepID=A0AAI8R9P3_ENTMU|nr:response regulator transcription factor [Enterococcus mundtii]MBE9911739.1 response regulator transcription factor [Enterococcus mundtii]MCA6773455.1 response regulator transcription factor [Enterococcus mundtii]QCJ55167.1 DNA-binding response regulator [Enterococcus mundtii]UBM05302.1 response regulator transcription factor [Enterococcus mundtii]BAO05633.1 luxR family DNA-binding response regulator [Enterococcus mundtii QU 25]
MKIILFDDHELFLQSLELYLRKYFDHFVTCNHRKDCLEVVKQEKPDIVLMDIRLGEKNGLEEGEKILKLFPETKLMFLSGSTLIRNYEEAINMGAKAFVNKTSSVEDLVTKIHLVNGGDTIFPEYEKIYVSLTKTEKKILQLVAQGKSQQEIAEIIYSSRRTVSTHMQHIFNKLNVHSTVTAVVRGIELGIITIEM